MREIKLETPIRYSAGDPVEEWLEKLLCLSADATPPSISGCPVPGACELYEVNRDTLFSFNPVSELFLRRMMALYVSSHYKNTPNDLQLLSDAPSHKVFCLLGPVDADASTLPEILCVVQFALEGEISRETARAAFRQGIKIAGDMIPWTLGQQLRDDEFPQLSGGRVVRIATHPDYQGMGYGKRTLSLLSDFYDGLLTSLDESSPAEPASGAGAKPRSRLEALEPRQDLPPLLRRVADVKPDKLDWLGVSFGLTPRLFKFWKTAGWAPTPLLIPRCFTWLTVVTSSLIRYVPLYLRQNTNELTGERSIIMVKPLARAEVESEDWIDRCVALYFIF